MELFSSDSDSDSDSDDDLDDLIMLLMVYRYEQMRPSKRMALESHMNEGLRAWTDMTKLKTEETKLRLAETHTNYKASQLPIEAKNENLEASIASSHASNSRDKVRKMPSTAQKGKGKASWGEDEKDNGFDSEKSEKKASWDAKAHEIWVDAFVAEIRAGNRVRTSLSKIGWKNLVTKFNAATGREYNKDQLKNHHDSTRRDWVIWNNLVDKESGVGWDSERKTIAASDEWWEAKLKKYPEATKFRIRGLEHAFKLDEIYRDVTTTEERAWAPTFEAAPLVFENSVVGDGGNAEMDTDSEETNLHDDPTEEDSTTYSTSGSGQKRHKQDKRGKRLSAAEKLSKQIDRLCDILESRKRTDLPGCSIKEVLDHMGTMPECHPMGELFMFGTDLFMKREYREMFVALGDDETRLDWLKRRQRDRQTSSRPRDE